jgi:hypothetical protein
LIQPPIGHTFYKTNDWGNTKDIIAAILEADETARLYTEDFANSIPGESVEDICKFLYGYVRRNVKYNEDPDGRQDVQMPGVLVDRKSGDCKSMSLFCASVLSNLEIPYKYRFISQDPKSDYHHVYLIVDAGRGKKIALDCVEDTYNNEVKYVKKKDMKSTAKIGNIVITKITRPPAFTQAQSFTQAQHKPLPAVQNDDTNTGVDTSVTATTGISTTTWMLIGAAVLGLYYFTKD